ncbi:MAG: hypothetical protein P9M10_00045 [Candidatus Euphemobacter frigidus]|nr:hypothetical protein [Candidatus Euphemobacter frigidus]
MKGIIFHSGKEMIRTSPRERILDLSELSEPAFDLYELNNYRNLKFYGRRISLSGGTLYLDSPEIQRRRSQKRSLSRRVCRSTTLISRSWSPSPALKYINGPRRERKVIPF